MKNASIGGVSLMVLVMLGAGAPFAIANAAPSATADARSTPLSPTVIKLLQDADKAGAAGNLSLALIQLKNAVRLAPQNPEIRARLGAALLRNREAVAAERELRQARNDGAPDEMVVPGILQAMIVRNYTKELLAEFPDPRQGTPDNIAADIFRARAIALNVLGRPAEAKIAIERSLRLRRDGPSLLAAARLAAQQNDVARARSLSEEVVKLEPTSEDALVVMVALMRQAGERDKAVATADEFLRRVPQSMIAKLLRIELMIDANQDAAAKQEVEALLKLSPRSPYGNYYRAVLLARAKDFRGAWQVTQTLSPEFIQSEPTIALMVARIAAADGNLESGGAILTTLVSRRPEYTPARLQLAALRLNQKSSAAALEVLAPIKDSDEPIVQALLAQAYLQLRRFDEAIGSLEIATASGGSSDLLKRQLALSQMRVGNMDIAIQELKNLLEDDPGNSEIATPLVAALLRSGKGSEALAVTDRLAKATATATTTTNKAIPAFLRGQILIVQGDLVGASTAFGQALSADPQFIPALYYRANVSAARGNYEEANRDIQQVLSQDSRNVLAYIKLAEFALNNNQEAVAIATLQKAIAAVPNDPTPRLALANYQLSRRNYAEARATVSGLLQVSRNNPEGLALQGQIQYLSGATKEAIATYRTIVAQNQQVPAAHILLAQALMGTKDYLAAKDAARRAIQLAPDAPQAHAVLIQAEIAGGENVNALASARAFATDHRGPAADLLLADTFIRLKRPNDASATLERSLASNPSAATATQLSRVALSTGDTKKALSVLSGWLAKSPNDIEVRRSYASLLLDTGDVNGGRREFEAVLKQNPADAVSLNNLGWIIQKENPARALSLVTQAEKIAPRSPEIADTLGWLKYQGQDYQGALPLLQKARGLDANNAMIAYHLALVLDATGKRAEAKTLLQATLASNPNFEEAESAKTLLARW